MKLSLWTYLRRGAGVFYLHCCKLILKENLFFLRTAPPSLPATSLSWSGEITCLAGQTRKQVCQNFRANHSCMVSYSPGQTNSCCCTGLRGDPFHPTHNCSSASLHLPKTGGWIVDAGKTALLSCGRWLVALASGTGSPRRCWPVQGWALWWRWVKGMVVATLVLLVSAELLRHSGGEWWAVGALQRSWCWSGHVAHCWQGRNPTWGAGSTGACACWL